MRSVKNGGSISFTASRGGYYVFLKASAEEKRDEDSGTGDQAAGNRHDGFEEGLCELCHGNHSRPYGRDESRIQQLAAWIRRGGDSDTPMETYAGVKNQPEGAEKEKRTFPGSW